MRFFILILLVINFSGISELSAQNNEPVPVGAMCISYCRTVEKDAEIDLNIWKKYLENHFEPDSLALDSIPPGVYKISAHIMIDKAGKVSVVRIAEDPGFGLGQRLKTVIENYPGRWKPAERNGRVVKNYRIQPVIFIVGEEDNCTTESLSGLML
jgi:hypothetical protein